ncbi:histone H1A, sperm-like [Chelonus insularis]|uniref:histone H1A, sperm-like n=1 Tax=Chelonus insularis TaxID=460826 RepID=UPI00158CC73C|nr:histone H1A, sperm-like [Chelonus insularis]
MVEISKIPSSFNKMDVKSKSKVKPSHPPTSKMVETAIFSLKDRRGSSLQAIKKYIVTNYNLNSEKIAPLVRRYIKFAISKGKLIQTKGKGASGSFKLPSANQKVQNKTSKTSITDIDLKKKSKVSSTRINKSVATTKSNISIKKSITKVSKLSNKQKIEQTNKKERKTHDIQRNSPKDAKKNKISSTALKASKSKRNLRSKTLSKAK